MSLYFIRHGQTALNTLHQFNGGVDEELNEVGLRQAFAARKNLENIKIDCVYCSPLKRTRKTFECLGIDPSVPVRYDERLVERVEGDLTGTEINENVMRNIYLNLDNKTEVKGLESIDDVFKRVHAVLDEIKKEHHGKNVLIVAHGFVSRAIYFYFNPLPKSRNLIDVPESFTQNCEVRKYEI